MLDTANLLSYLSKPTEFMDSTWRDVGLGLGTLKLGLSVPAGKYTSSLKDTQEKQACQQTAFAPVRISSQKRLASQRRNNTSLRTRPQGPYISSSPNTEVNTRSKLTLIPTSTPCGTRARHRLSAQEYCFYTSDRITTERLLSPAPNSACFQCDNLIPPTKKKGGFSPPRSSDRDISDTPRQRETMLFGLGPVRIYLGDMAGCSDVEWNSDDSAPSTPSGSPSITPQLQLANCFTLNQLVDEAAAHPLGKSSIASDSSETVETAEELEFCGNGDWVAAFLLKPHPVLNFLNSTPIPTKTTKPGSLDHMKCTVPSSQPSPVTDFSSKIAHLPVNITEDRLVGERLHHASPGQAKPSTHPKGVPRRHYRMSLPPSTKESIHLNGNMRFDSVKMCWINMEENLDDPFADFSDDEESPLESTDSLLGDEFQLTPDELSEILMTEKDHKSTMQQWYAKADCCPNSRRMGVDYFPKDPLETRRMLK
ncbi:hypothetical protein K493DRAFT_334101 [Basidiobolus meristosporus CBS 931.73]|uniref:Uncharacterized protein n=1 Tax=Basidiobolus meristosporus CBS 931.73 TaxID=1314790 RepID=A0A1Y1Z0R1_9FUNG|nr:hypothetical protein K493DRAFT_334101 [Basidiobolus meristosporus CBS 931.73]|eukprot:ORY03872.1 hypothetical protein K493DRAFT_334101 [Basidiobolus meristosporus CBS 931.73]